MPIPRPPFPAPPAPGRRAAAHVQAAVGQAAPAPVIGRAPAPHVQAALGAAAQAKPDPGRPFAVRPAAPHVQAAVVQARAAAIPSRAPAVVSRPEPQRLAPPVPPPPPARSAPARPATLQGKFTVQKGGMKGNEEEEINRNLLPDIKQRQKKNLKGLLGTNLPKGLKLAFSQKKLQNLGLNEVDAIRVLEKVDEWASSKEEIGPFETWDDVVKAAVKALGIGGKEEKEETEKKKKVTSKKEDSGCPIEFLQDSDIQTMIKLLSVKEDSYPLLYEVFLSLAELYEDLVGKNHFSCSRFFTVTCVSVSIHGGESEGSLVTLHGHLKKSCCVDIPLWKKSIAQIIVVGEKVASLLELDVVELLDNIVSRIIGGSVQIGKLNLIVGHMTKILEIMTELQRLRFEERVTKKAGNRIGEQFMKIFWGVEQKNQAKMCRELSAAISVLEKNPGLTMTSYEKKWTFQKVDYEFDLVFTCFLETTKEKFVVELESEKEGTKNEWKEKAIKYYGDRWAKKYKNFLLLSKNYQIVFLLSPHESMPKNFLEEVQSYALKKHNVSLKITLPGLQFHKL